MTLTETPAEMANRLKKCIANLLVVEDVCQYV